MTNEQFDIFLENSIANFGDDYVELPDTPMLQHTFSKKFERKMARLIRRQKSFYFPMLKTPLRRTVTIIVTAVIVLSTMVMSVGAIRTAFLNFIAETFDTHTDVRSVYDPDAPLDFRDKYAMTADLSDFELTEHTIDIFNNNYIYENEHCYIIFDQSIKEYYNVAVNTEGFEMETVYVNGFEGYYIDMAGLYAKMIAWDNGDYVFTIDAIYDENYDVSKAEMITMAESVKIVG